MDMEITVSMSARKTVEVLTPILEKAQAAVRNGDTFQETFYGKGDGNADMIVHFDNDDMERPEVEANIYVDASEQ